MGRFDDILGRDTGYRTPRVSKGRVVTGLGCHSPGVRPSFGSMNLMRRGTDWVSTTSHSQPCVEDSDPVVPRWSRVVLPERRSMGDGGPDCGVLSHGGGTVCVTSPRRVGKVVSRAPYLPL